MLSTGRSLIGWAGVLIAWPSLIIPKSPSRGNFGDDGHVAFGTSQGFLNSPKTKYLGGDSVFGKDVHVWHFFLKNQFSKTICRIWTLWWFIGLALHFAGLDLEPWHLSPNCSSKAQGHVYTMLNGLIFTEVHCQRHNLLIMFRITSRLTFLLV